MDRRQFLKGVIATSAATVGTAALGGTSAFASTGSASASRASSTERFLLGTARRALA
jgi:hypothetical protein